MRFVSDNAAAACPAVIEAVVAANVADVAAYDSDPWSARLDAAFGALFETECRVFAVGTGTAANALALAAMAPPWGAVLAHADAHVHVDECGAPEFFSGGAKLMLVPGDHGKLTLDTLAAATAGHRGDIHQVQLSALTITQATEAGTVYTPPEVAALTAFARDRNLKTHMDGARFANAVAHLNCAPADLTWRAGIDALSFGAIKNGGMSAEAIVLFDMGLADEIGFRRKRAGQMPSKGRFHAAQLLGMIESGVWLANARAANAGAAVIAAASGGRLTSPAQANEIFAVLGEGGAARLREQGFHFYDWGDPARHEARFVVAWDTPREHIEALAAALAAL